MFSLLSAVRALGARRLFSRSAAGSKADPRVAFAAGAVAESLESRFMLTITAVSLNGVASVPQPPGYPATITATSSLGAVSSLTENYGDGTGTITFTPSTRPGSHHYAQPGNYVITGSATDADGTVAAAPLDVTITPGTLIASAPGGPAVPEGSPFQFLLTGAYSGSWSYEGFWPVASLTVNWGDASSTQTLVSGGAAFFSLNPQHVYANAGIYTVTAALTETGGWSTSATCQATIAVVAPTLEISGANSTVEAGTYTLNLSSSYPTGCHTISSWVVNWADGSSQSPDIQTISGNPSSVTHVYATAGSYHITAAAVNDEGTFDAGVLNGQLDPSFNTTGFTRTDFGDEADFGLSAALQPDGSGGYKLIAAGQDVLQPSFALARYNSNGSLDTSFGTDGEVDTAFNYDENPGASIAIEPNGDIVVGGQDENGSLSVARFLPNGAVDTSFGDGTGYVTTNFPGLGDYGNGGSWAIAIQGSQILAAGPVNDPDNGQQAGGVVRFNNDGSVDTSFGPYGTGLAVTDLIDWDFGLAVDGSGNILLSGDGSETGVSGDVSGLGVVRFTHYGNLDTGFGSNGDVILTGIGSGSVGGIRVQSNGKIVVAGNSGAYDQTDFAVARLNADGSLDTTFSASGIAQLPLNSSSGAVNAITMQANGDIIVAGQANNQIAVARFTAAGAADPTFGYGGLLETAIGGSSTASAVLVQPDGKIAIVGTTSPDAGNPVAQYNSMYMAVDVTFAVARYEVDNTLTVLPEAPTNVSVTGVTDSSVSLGWDVSPGATSYTILREGPDDSSYASIGTSSIASYTDSTTLADTSYSYEVIASIAAGSSAASTAVSALSAPVAATGLTAVDATDGSGDVVLNWTNNADSSVPFYIEQSADETNFSIIDETVAGATTYTDTLPADGTTYYRVDAVNNDGSAWSPSSIASVTNAILPPSDLSATAVSSSEIDLSWTNNSAVADGITILHSADGASYTTLTTLSDPTTDTYDDTTLSPGTHEYYEVEAIQESAASAPSAAADDTTTPPVPTGLAIMVGPSSAPDPTPASELDLSWTAAPGATGYDIEREASSNPQPSDANWQNIGQVTGGATTFADTALWDGVTYAYRIDAYNNVGTSATTTAVTATTATTAPVAPTVQLFALSQTSAQLIWTNNAYNESSFIIKRSDDSGGSWTTLATLAPGVDTYTDSTLSADEFYMYSVTAHNSAGDASNSTSVYTGANDSTGVAVQAVQGAAELGPDGQPGHGFFEFTRGGDPSAELTVDYTVDSASTAAAGTEYEALPGSITFAQNQSAVLAAVTPNEMNHVEGTTAVTVDVTSESGYTVNPDAGTATVDITNTDDVAVSVASETVPFGVPSQDVVTVTNHYGRPKPKSLALAVGDSTIVSLQQSSILTGDDGEAPAPITGLSKTEGTTTLFAHDSIGNTSTGGTLNVSAPVTVWVSDALTGGLKTPVQDASFTIERSGDASAPLNVYYALSGSAVQGVDYKPLPLDPAGTGMQLVHFAAGASTATVSIVPCGAPSAEEYQSVTLALDDPPTAAQSAAYLLASDLPSAPVPSTAPAKDQVTIDNLPAKSGYLIDPRLLLTLINKMDDDDFRVRLPAESELVKAALNNPTPARLNQAAIDQIQVFRKAHALTAEQNARLDSAIGRIKEFNLGIPPIVIHLSAPNQKTTIDIPVVGISSNTVGNLIRVRSDDKAIVTSPSHIGPFGNPLPTEELELTAEKEGVTLIQLDYVAQDPNGDYVVLAHRTLAIDVVP